MSHPVGKMFGPKAEREREREGGRIQFHNEKLDSFKSIPNVINLSRIYDRGMLHAL